MFSWRQLEIKRFYGLDKKTNIIDVKNANSIDSDNVFQNKTGVISKRNGTAVMFDKDSTANTIKINEIGSCVLNGTKYYFKFYNGKFAYSSSLNGTAIELSAPSIIINSVTYTDISTTNDIWFSILDDKLFFVDGTNPLRYFDGTNLKNSIIYSRPTSVLTSASGAGSYDYTYTIDNGDGESPICSTILTNKITAANVVVDLTDNPGLDDVLEGYIIRVYSKINTVAVYKKVREYTVLAADVSAGSVTLSTVSINDDLQNLYTDLGLAINKTAPIGLSGIISHYGRLIGWKDDYVYNSKISNPHSWPDNSVAGESFVYGFGLGDGEDISCCVSYLESLFVLKPTKIAVFAGIGPDDSGGNAYSLRRLETNGIGCIAPKSAVVVGEEEFNQLIFLSREGFYATSGSKPQRIGENIETEIQPLGKSILQKSMGFHYKKEGFYVCFVGTDSNKTTWLVDVRKDQGTMVGWFKLSDLNATCVHWDDDRFIYGRADGVCLYERVSLTASDFSDARIEYVSSANVNAGSDSITVSNEYETGDQISIRSGSVPGGLSVNTTYYVIKVSPTVIKLAVSLENAQGNIPIDITSSGTGNHTLVSMIPINAYYTTNWINFGNPALVKKLGKPLILLNATATSVNLRMLSAYDWVPDFVDEKPINIQSSHLWGNDLWGSFVWGGGIVAQPKNVAIARRKCRAVRYKFVNNELNQDFDLQGLMQSFAMIRNRGNFA
ncbi:MAG: Prochlorococcus phage [Bacteroidota bacterium]|jgi:hypothetical protein